MPVLSCDGYKVRCGCNSGQVTQLLKSLVGNNHSNFPLSLAMNMGITHIDHYYLLRVWCLYLRHAYCIDLVTLMSELYLELVDHTLLCRHMQIAQIIFRGGA